MQAGLSVTQDADPKSASMMLLSLEAALTYEGQQVRSGKQPSLAVPPIQRSLASASQKLDLAAKGYLLRISDSMKDQFKSASPSKYLIESPAPPLQVEKIDLHLKRPGVLHPAHTVKLEEKIEMDVDIVPKYAPKPTPTVIEKPTVTVKSILAGGDSSSLKKKNRNTNYGVGSKYEMDSKDEDVVVLTQPQTSAFKTALQKLDEDNARNGKPLLAGKDTKDKKRPRTTVEEMAGLSDEDEDLQSATKKPTLLASQVTGSLVSRFSKLTPVSSSSHSNNKATANGTTSNGAKSAPTVKPPAPTESEVEVYKGIDPEIAERVLNEILDTNMNVKWTDIAGLEDVKETLREMIILPNLHPEMFTGLRAPPRGLLLFGPPGNGKTMIAKAIATEAGLTFFSISASVLCSKWIGEGEKTMRALFTIARAKAPSFIFIDEVDSILCSRSSEEHESSRRLKNEFLTQFDGATSSPEDAVTIMGATNRPFDLDDAARRRMPKRIYVPLPEQATRYNLLSNLLKGESHALSEPEIQDIAQRLEGYSCSDIHQLSQQAAMGPVRDKMKSGLMTGALRAIGADDFRKAIDTTRPSVAPEECKLYEDFSEKFGTRGL